MAPVYLDNAGGCEFTKEQIKAVFKDLEDFGPFSNPHSQSSAGIAMKKLNNEARERVLSHFMTTGEEYSLIFTANATAACRLLADSFTWRTTNNNATKLLAPPNNPSDKQSFKLREVDTALECPAFVYLDVNHVSVIGMREPALISGAKVYCVSKEELEHRLTQTKGIMSGDCKGECNNLFVYPAASNFCGRKYSLDWIDVVKKASLGCGNWYVALDATSFVATSPLDLSKYKPDFIALSFYKMFGYPTGLGALMVRNRTGRGVMQKLGYFGGGTTAKCVPMMHYKEDVESFVDKYEDGTPSFLSILGLKHGFESIESFGGIEKISQHVFNLASSLFHKLISLKHTNGSPVAQMFNHSGYEDIHTQGGIAAFHLLNSTGDVIDPRKIQQFCDDADIQIGVGNFCNPGAWQKYLNIPDEDLTDPEKTKLYQPAIRISFGRNSTEDHIDKFLAVLMNFIE